MLYSHAIITTIEADTFVRKADRTTGTMLQVITRQGSFCFYERLTTFRYFNSSNIVAAQDCVGGAKLMLQKLKKSQSLFDTKIWHVYEQATMGLNLYERIGLVKKLYTKATSLLKKIGDTFGNYTLHDETHVLNILDAMEGILGDAITKLNIDECELLILSAALHDVGMVYFVDEATDERKTAFSNQEYLKHFYEENPDYFGCSISECSIKEQQNYLRSIHHLRVREVVYNYFSDVLDEWPIEMVNIDVVIAVCQSHGENLDELINNKLLRYDNTLELHPLFCSELLRLADLLDFDDTRTPQVLLHYARNDEKSIAEWQKHLHSAGFNYGTRPSTNELAFRARCDSVIIANSIMKFLDWIDKELDNSRILKTFFEKNWQKEFQFPSKVSRDQIISDNFANESFSLTIDENQILNLFSGNTLYGRNDVFIRELVQNSVDATLLRSEIDSNFSLENAPIEMWEWSDEEGNDWFRIDDYGIGMTLGMLKRFFLKVGSSYYHSKELKHDLYRFSAKTEFSSIGQFGIGFLSCFMCGLSAEISTLYFDDEKNKQENRDALCSSYGVRFEMEKGEKFYTIRRQDMNHRCDKPMKSHPKKLDKESYRITPGTSILIKLDRSVLGAVDLKKSAQEFVMGTRMPVFYNGVQIGKTITEIKQLFEAQKCDFEYEIDELTRSIFYEYSQTTNLPSPIFGSHISISNDFSEDCTFVCEEEFFRLPEIDDKLYDVIHVSRDPYSHEFSIMVQNLFNPDGPKFFHKTFPFPGKVFSYDDKRFFQIYYNGVLQARLGMAEGNGLTHIAKSSSYNMVECTWGTHGSVFLEKSIKPIVDVSRSTILFLPLEVIMFINYMIDYSFDHTYSWDEVDELSIINVELKELRSLINTKFGVWLIDALKKKLRNLMLSLGNKDGMISHYSLYDNSGLMNMNAEKSMILLLAAYIQINYETIVDFSDSIHIEFIKKEVGLKYDHMPIMMFCKSKNKTDEKFICSEEAVDRCCINADNDFVKWLIDNQKHLTTYFRKEYYELIDSLKFKNSDRILESIQSLRTALISFDKSKLDYSVLESISNSNFWTNPRSGLD